MTRRLALLGSDYRPQALDQSRRHLVNFYLEPATDIEKGTWVALPTPGFNLFTTLTGGKCRVGGAIAHNGLIYFTVGDKFYEVNPSTAIETLRGTINTLTGHMEIAAIEDEIVLVDGTNGYSYKPSTTTFTTIVDVDFPSNPTSVTALRDYFIAPDPGTQIFYVSDLTDGTSYSATSFAASEIDYDKLVAAKAENYRLWLLGEYTTEVWVNSGADSGAPFDRSSAGAVQFGCAAANSAVSVDNKIYWLAQNKMGLQGVIEASESGQRIISSPPMVQEVLDYHSFTDAFAILLQQGRHAFYSITFPSKTASGLGVTWLYDITSENWSILESYEPTYAIPKRTRHKANSHVYINGKHLIGDHTTGNIYELRHDAYTENSETISREIITRNVTVSGSMFRVMKLELELQRSVALDGDVEGSDPKVTLMVSKDGGHTWGNAMERSIGKLGESKKRVLFGRLGSSRRFTFKLQFSDPVPYRILGAWVTLDVEGGQQS